MVVVPASDDRLAGADELGGDGADPPLLIPIKFRPRREGGVECPFLLKQRPPVSLLHEAELFQGFDVLPDGYDRDAERTRHL
jgi:hypothetical protein